jgi:dTDP-4-dehydrorhamnose 3,5-epimerase
MHAMWKVSSITRREVQGSAEIQQFLHADERGWFSRVFEALPGGEFPFGPELYVNNSSSKYAGTLRGLHWQTGEHGETKVVRCVRGSVLDLIVDVRTGSPTFGKCTRILLSADRPSVAYVPRGCAHGVLSLVDDSEIIYFSDRPYAPDAERGLRYDDPLVEWSGQIRVEHISDKDNAWPPLKLGD